MKDRDKHASDCSTARWPSIRAPGKVKLSGEYGVLMGSSALIMAVDRYILLEDKTSNLKDPLMRILLEEAAKHAVIPARPPYIDDSAFKNACGEKLGLGSSAAKAAAVLGASLAISGENILSFEVKQKILDLALQSHRRAGGGSGADVAASVMGGFVVFRLLAETSALVSDSKTSFTYNLKRINLPDACLPMIVHGGNPLSTRNAITKLQRLYLDKKADSLRVLLQDTALAGEALTDALSNCRLKESDILHHVKNSRALLTRLAQELGMETPQAIGILEAVDSIAKSHGGAAKPSGAGVGDLVLLFLPSASNSDRRKIACRLKDLGLELLHLCVDFNGVSFGS